MIEFKGEISEICKKYALRQSILFASILIVLELTVLGIPFILMGIYLNFWLMYIAWAVIGVPLTFYVVIDSESYYYPISITIDNEEICLEAEEWCTTRKLEDVKKVKDLGEIYHILFYFPNKLFYCICQKNLITQGTIEEFEQLFKDEIVRKIK